MQYTKILPKKSLAQHFLTDESYLARIVAAANLTPDDTVVEIGPGPGNLTRYMAAQAGRVIAIELDDRLIEPLRKLLEAREKLSDLRNKMYSSDKLIQLLDDVLQNTDKLKALAAETGKQPGSTDKGSN